LDLRQATTLVSGAEKLGGVPRRRLFDNAKKVTLGKYDEGRVAWNLRMLDIALRVGFEIWLCQPYLAQTKGKVESGVKYVKGNIWPSMRFTRDGDLNRQGLEWCDSVASRRIHGTTGKVPWEMLAEERPHLGRLTHRYTLRLTPGRTERWPGTASSDGRAPEMGTTASGSVTSCRRANVTGLWRSEPRSCPDWPSSPWLPTS